MRIKNFNQLAAICKRINSKQMPIVKKTQEVFDKEKVKIPIMCEGVSYGYRWGEKHELESYLRNKV